MAPPPRKLGTLPTTLEIGEIVREGVFLPVTIRGEMPGRAMRGSADLKRLPCWTESGRRLA
jgi:hypothetical protein